MYKILFSLIATGAILGSPLNRAEAHYVENDPNVNHAHVCTSSTSLNLRETPSTGGKVVGSVKQAAVVKIKASYSDWETQETWYKIYNGKTFAYVSGQYICF